MGVKSGVYGTILGLLGQLHTWVHIPIDTVFCTPYDLGPWSLMMLNSKTQGWFRVQSEVKLT